MKNIVDKVNQTFNPRREKVNALRLVSQPGFCGYAMETLTFGLDEYVRRGTGITQTELEDLLNRVVVVNEQ
jgi:hypothetical protein